MYYSSNYEEELKYQVTYDMYPASRGQLSLLAVLSPSVPMFNYL